MGREQSLTLLITVSSGSGTGTITNVWDTCKRFRVCPPSETNTYNVNIKDADGFLIWQTVATQTGTLAMHADLSLGIAKTVNITGASADGTYTVKLDMHG